ncbi:MAG: hypothetical protein AAGE03_01740 [Pseudomonadota bacterium]
MRMLIVLVATPLAGCLANADPASSPLFIQQNLCFEEAGLPPVRGLEGGHEMSDAQFAVFDACMNRAIPQREGSQFCYATEGSEEIICDG